MSMRNYIKLVETFNQLIAEHEKIDVTDGWKSVSDDLSRWSKATEKHRQGNVKPDREWTFDGFKYEYTGKDGSNPYAAHRLTVLNDSGDVVATLHFDFLSDDPGFMEGVVQVHPSYRRKGIAKHMYDLGEQIMGGKFKPSTSHSPLAQAFWKDRKNGE